VVGRTAGCAADCKTGWDAGRPIGRGPGRATGCVTGVLPNDLFFGKVVGKLGVPGLFSRDVGKRGA
jgi:hypothetical protein